MSLLPLLLVHYFLLIVQGGRQKIIQGEQLQVDCIKTNERATIIEIAIKDDRGVNRHYLIPSTDGKKKAIKSLEEEAGVEEGTLGAQKVIVVIIPLDADPPREDAQNHHEVGIVDAQGQDLVHDILVLALLIVIHLKCAGKEKDQAIK